MKHILTFLLTVAAALAFCTNVCAAEAIEEDSKTMDSAIAQILDSQLSNDEKETLKNSEKLNLSDEPILQVYSELYWCLADKPLQEIITKAEADCETYGYRQYYVFSDTPYRIAVLKGKAGKIEDSIQTPQYVKDISALSKQVTIGADQLDVKGIYCFDGHTSQDGIIVYILTNAGTFIKYYEHLDSEALVFSESEFQAYASDYNAYITSYEYNYNENGEPLGGAVLPFKAFIDNRASDNINHSIGNNDTDVDSSLSTHNHQYLWLGFSLLFVIGAIMIGYGIYKKKTSTAVINGGS